MAGRSNWRSNRDGGTEEGVDLDAGSVRLEIRRQDGNLEMRPLSPAVFAFRQALSVGRSLAVATEAALGEDRGFEAVFALAALAGEAALTGFALED